MSSRAPLSLLALLALGCARTSPVSSPGFLRATPIVEHGAPSAASGRARGADGDAEEPEGSAASAGLATQSELMGSVPPPRTPAVAAAPSDPMAVIAEANQLASQAPEAEGFVNAVMQYAFVPGGIYKVFTAPQMVTDLVLEPGEEILGEPAAGDTLRWRLGVGSSAVAGVPQKHLFIKPTRAGLATNLTINTNRRTYFVQLESVERTAMLAVQWHYPEAEQAGAGGPQAPSGARRLQQPSPADVTALHFDYVIEVTQGSPAWKPKVVFDDGKKTYIRFERQMLQGESPVLFVIERDEMQLVNYRVKQNLYIVDRLFRIAELRLGQDDPDIVRIRRK